MADDLQNAHQKPPETGNKRARPALSGISETQRAAVILSILGKNAGERLLNRLDDTALAKIRIELERMPHFKRTELLNIVTDFVGHIQDSSKVFIDGRAEIYELAEQLERSRIIAAKTTDGELAIEEDTADPSESVWSKLERLDPAQTAAYLDKLTPSLIAIILGKLPTLLCSDILNQLDDNKLRPVMAHLVEPEVDDPALEAVIGRMIEMEYLNAAQAGNEESHEQLESIGEILSLVPSDRRESLMEFLQQEHGEKLSFIEKTLFTIEVIPDVLPRAAIPLVFREMDMKATIQLIASLQATHSAISEYLLSNISSRLAASVKEELTDQSPMSEEEVDNVHREFVGRIMDLKRSGRIELQPKSAA